jgi:hypothetical protein
MMNLIQPQRLEDYIIKFLTGGEQTTASLLSNIRSKRKNTTKQGFYAALRKLKSDEIILVYKSIASLNTVWIKKMRDLFEVIGKTYTVDQKSFDVLGLENKESISYTFSNTKSLDIFWGHAQNIIVHNTSKDQPIYAYDPHYWFYIARKETETELLKEIAQKGRQFLMTVGGSTKLDKIIQKDFVGDLLQYSHKKIFEDDNYYVTVIGDYITEVFLDEKMGKKIDEIYRNKKISEQDSILTLKGFLDEKVRNKIKISKNKTRADKLKTKMGKDFYIIRP